jgi:hypothetical protein
VKQEIANRWVTALRSGEYAQGKDELHPEPGHYCCLGVLTDLYLRETGMQWGAKTLVGVAYPDDTCLPRAVELWASMRSDCGKLPPEARASSAPDAGSLVELNDGACDAIRAHTFAEIADVIEKYWEVL